MNDVPKAVILELEDKDVREDFLKVMSAMDRIRKERISDREITREQKNEYLHLAVRLASGIEALADEKTLGKMDFVVKQLDRNPALFAYDYLQDGFWRESEPEFTRSLDNIVISLEEDDFADLEDKHHLLNALKYLGSKDEELKKRLEIYDTILPFNTPSMEQNRKLFEGELKRLRIEGIQEQDEITANVKNSDDVERVLSVAQKLGFSNVKTIIGKKKYEEIEKKYPGSSIVGDESSVNSLKFKRGKFAKAFGKIKPLTYPILGASSSYVQESLERRVGKENFDAGYSTIHSFIGFLSYGALYTIYHIVRRKLEDVTGLNLPDSSLAFGLSVLGQEAIRMFRASSKANITNDHRPAVGNIAGTILFSPLSLYFHLTNDEDSVRNVANIKLVSPEAEPKIGRLQNYHKLLDEFAKEKLPEDIENNLVWSLDNHHTQGYYFADRVIRNKKLLGKFGKLEHLDRELGALTLYDKRESGPYQKTSAIVCFKGRRYVMTYVTGKKENDFNTVSNLLSTDKKMNEKISELSGLTDAEYLHLTEYANGGREDLTATK